MKNILKFTADLQIPAAAMVVQRRRMKLIAENKANAETPHYRAKRLQVTSRFNSKLGVDLLHVQGVSRDPGPVKHIYNPSDPNANKEGFVAQSNVNLEIENGNGRAANYSHNASLKAYENIRSTLLNTLNVLDSKN